MPRICEEVTGESFPTRGDEGNALRADDWEVLREVCGDDPAFFDLQVGLLGVERQVRGTSRRGGVFERLEERLETGLYGSEAEPVEVLGGRRKKREEHGELFRKELPMVDGVGEAEGE